MPGAAFAVAALCLWGGAQQATAAAIDPFYPPGGLTLSVQDDRLESVTLAGRELETRLDLIDRLGVTITRVDVHWSQIAPTEPASPANDADPAYRWARYDRVFDGLAARGIIPTANIFWTPSWANGGNGPEWAPDPDAYEAFVTAFASRYDGTGGHARVSVYEPWNEPNMGFFLRPQWRVAPQGTTPTVTVNGTGYVPASPEIYAEILRRAYRAIKAVQPDAAVLGLATGPAATNAGPGTEAGTGSVGFKLFVSEVAKLSPPLDAHAIHIYPAAQPSSPALLSFGPRLQTEVFPTLDLLGPGLPVLVTEFGWRTLPTATTPGVPEADQARYLDEAVRIMAKEPRFRSGTWFNLQDNPGWPAGLRREDGTAKPSWDVMLGIPRFITPTDTWLVPPPAPDPPPPPPEPPPPAPAPEPAAPVTVLQSLPPPAPLPAPEATADPPPARPLVVRLRAPATARSGRTITLRLAASRPVSGLVLNITNHARPVRQARLTGTATTLTVRLRPGTARLRAVYRDGEVRRVTNAVRVTVR